MASRRSTLLVKKSFSRETRMNIPSGINQRILIHAHPEIEKNVPSDLKAIKQWITWRAGLPQANGKFDKIPVGSDGTGVQWQQAHQWMSFDQALANAKDLKHSGVGIVLPALLADGNHLVALDYDTVDLERPTGNARLEEIKATHERLGEPYVETSPSGKGLRMFVSSAIGLKQISCSNPQGGKDELFCTSAKWVTVTGERQGGTGVPEATEEIKAIAEKWTAISKSKTLASNSVATDSFPILDNLIGKTWSGWPAQKLRDGDGREEQLLAYAGHLRGKGFMQAEIERLCLEANHKHYEDPLDEAVVLDRTQRYAEPTSSSPRGVLPTTTAQALVEPSLLDQVDHTDAGNVALLFNLTASDLRYVVERNQWIVWQGNRWQLDKGHAATHQNMLKVSAHHRKLGDKCLKDADAAGNPDQRKKLSDAGKMSLKWAAQCRNKNRLDAMLTIAKRDSRFLIEANQLDSDPCLLGVGNGVVDLRTGVLRPDSKTDYVLKRCATEYDLHAQAPRWNQFVDEITAAPGNVIDGKVAAIVRPHLADYLQKALGYCLTGRVNEHIMFIAIGRGANGKNVLLDTFQSIAGDYCETIAPEVLMATRLDNSAEQASPSTRKLAGARCAISSESKDGQRLDIAVVKRHTGGGSMTARALHENPITFEITHKLWLMTNHSPRVDHMDEATKGRLHLIPFDMKWNRPGETRPDTTLPVADKKLMDTLATEKEGILLWMVAGAVKYHTDGLMPPNEVVAFTTSYIESQDTLARWLSEDCEVCPIDQGLLAKELLHKYSGFCVQEDESPQIDKPNNLSRKLKALSHASKKTKNGVRFGLRQKSTEDPAQAKQVLEAILDGWGKSAADANTING